ncbi:MAG: carbonic anhydrase family protein [Gammaproteobacteria bacterium]|nr:carbonic anhydrase family protein [Gammaproteobacteria bacterium]
MTPKNRQLCVLMVLSALLAHHTQAHGSHASPDEGNKPLGFGWAYQGDKGPDHWGEMSPYYATCGTGKNQSPIDIQRTLNHRLPNLSFSYRSSPLTILNDGHTIRVHYEPGSYLSVGSRKYQLLQFHFHTPGEHTFGGQRPDMVMHLVHQNQQGEVVEVAVPMIAGVRRNAMMERLLRYLPLSPGENHYYRNVGIKPIFLLPSDRSYSTYRGSMTEPPCTENVTWILFNTALEVSAPGIERFRQIMGQSNRPIQATNNRPVYSDYR